MNPTVPVPTTTGNRVLELVKKLLADDAPNKSAAELAVEKQRTTELNQLLEVATYDEICAAHNLVREQLAKNIVPAA